MSATEKHAFLKASMTELKRIMSLVFPHLSKAERFSWDTMIWTRMVYKDKNVENDQIVLTVLYVHRYIYLPISSCGISWCNLFIYFYYIWSGWRTEVKSSKIITAPSFRWGILNTEDKVQFQISHNVKSNIVVVRISKRI